MGACLSSLGVEQGQAIREAFGGAKPEALHQDLRPLLALDFDGLAEAYQRAASLRLETALPTHIATLFGIPPQVARRLCRCKAAVPPPAPRPKSARVTSKGPSSVGQQSPLSSSAAAGSGRRPSRPSSAAGNARNFQVIPTGMLEVLTTLAMLSHTHELVKIRFLFSIFDRDGEGLLDPEAVAGVARALSWAAGCLSQPPIDTPGNLALFDMAVRALFPKGVDKVHSGVLVNALLGWDLTCHFLRRFSRGGSATPFCMEPWNSYPLPFLDSEADGDGQNGVTRYKDHPPVLPPTIPTRRPASAGPTKGRPSTTSTVPAVRPGSAASAMAGAGARPSPSARSAMSAMSVRSATSALSEATAAGAVSNSNQNQPPFTPKQGATGAGGLVTMSPRSPFPSPEGSGLATSRFGNMVGRSPMGQNASPVKATPAQAPAGAAGVADLDDAPLPTRNGYFQSVASPDAQELLGELDEVRTSKHKALNEHNRGQAIELQSKEDALVSEIWREAADQSKRKEYRKLLEEFRRQVPGGRWWTASKDHILRGGVLPCNVKRPLLPAEVQQKLLASGRLRAPAGKAKKQRQSKELDQSRTERRLAIFLGKAADANHDTSEGAPGLTLDAESLQGSSDESSEGERSHASKIREAGRIRVKRRDALLAFEMYRWSYWRHRQAPNQRHLDKSTARRNKDIDAIFAEQLASDAKPASWFVGCSTLDLTLKMFLRKLWPRCSKEEMSAMMHWILHSKENSHVQARFEREAADASPMCLRELVELFDAVDQDRVGKVSLDGIERFLCGEITTDREAADLKRYKEDLGDGRSVIEFERYRDVNREMHSLRFMNSTIPDRKEWQLFRESRDRRMPPTPAASAAPSVAAGPTSEAVAQAQAMAKTLGRHMEKLGKFLDEACSKRDKSDTESVLAKNIEVATKPLSAATKLSDQQLSLVRLYYRHLLGSALHALLRSEGEQGSAAHIRIQQNGKLDLLSFINLMAADQVASFLPPGKVPSECLIRRIAHGVQ